MFKVLPDYFYNRDQPLTIDTAEELTGFLNYTTYKCFVRMY